MGGYMNGHAQAASTAAPNTITSPLGLPGDGTAPLITVNQLSLTGAQLRNMVIAITALFGIGGTTGYFVLPWPDKADVRKVTDAVDLLKTEGIENRRIVQQLAEDNRQTREAVKQLTDAIRAVNETVIDMRIAVESRPDPAPVVAAPRPRPRPRPAPAVAPAPPAPTPRLTPGG